MDKATVSDRRLDELCVHSIRMLSIEGVEQANSGHPGLPMGAAPMAYVLWDRLMKMNPGNPSWFNRDRFVLSAGHGSMLLYSLLHLYGYELSIEELKRFRQWGSLTPGHPEYGHTPGVEATTGPLGQGIAMAAGMAMAERHLAATFNREHYPVVDHFTYCLCGDGDLMEGVSAEAASLAGHLGLGRLIVLYDSNDISLDGATDMAFTEKVADRFAAYGWQVLRVDDGNDLEALEQALREAVRETERPSFIEVKTTIGYGSPNKGGTSEAHGSPLGREELELVRKHYGWQHSSFEVPDEVRSHMASRKQAGEQAEAEWQSLWERYKTAYPDEAGQLEKAVSGELPEGWSVKLPRYEEGGKIATRDASGQTLNAIAVQVPNFWGGSADLASSNKTNLAGEGVFSSSSYQGRNIWFGVREHAMGAMLNGISLHGGLRVFGGTFFVFSDYLKPAMRLSALMKQPVLYVLTHDSIYVGEDGPTHEPIEQLAGLRSMPGMTVFRPADGNETVHAYRYALEQANGPVALVLSRQGLPVLPDTAFAAGHVARGAYVMSDFGGPSEDILLLATGSEVSLALQVRMQLASRGIGARVVSMPSWELFDRQPLEYKEAVLPERVSNRVAIEMASTFGWERYVGRDGLLIGIDVFGASAPGERLAEEFGFTPDRVAARIMKRFYSNLDHNGGSQ
jgi:transketolase